MKIKTPKYGDIFAGSDDGEKRAEYARIIWAESLSELEVGIGVTVARVATLDRYVRARTEYHFIYPIASAQGPTHKSDKGNDYVNMKWAAVQNLDDKILKHEKALGFHPRSEDMQSPRGLVDPPKKASKYLDRSKAH